MQVASVNNVINTKQNIQQTNSLNNGFDISYNQLIAESNSTTSTQELIDSYKADLLAKLEESPNSSISSSDILNLMINIK